MTALHLTLTMIRDEAEVLFEALVKLTPEALQASGLDQVEAQALYDLEAELERRLPDTLAEDYDKRLAATKTRLLENKP